MKERARLCAVALVALFAALAPAVAGAQDSALVSHARGLLAAGNPKQAYEELSAAQDRMSGQPEFDYLLGVAALDSGRLDEAIIAFERVLAVMPNHAGAQMDLARAYYAAGSFDLAQAAFEKLRDENPPPAAREAIGRYLQAIEERKHQTQAGWARYGELGLGYDSNITGVPVNFGAAAQQSFNLSGIEPTGNAIKRSAAFLQAGAGADYFRPLTRGWSAFGGGEVHGRGYAGESDFNSYAAELHGGGALNEGPNQWRFGAYYNGYWQQGDAPGDPQPTNDRRMGGATVDWRHALDSKTQVGLGLQLNAVRFPTNSVEDFDQVYLSGSWLHSFERKGVPLLYVTAFVTDDRARNDFTGATPGTTTSKSKNLAGVRSVLQYSLDPKVQLYGSVGLIARRDQDSFARSTTVEKGRDTYADATLGVAWTFRDKCALRLQYTYSRNSSNIDIYDFDRSEISSTIRCDMN
jgi:tetratricopeptide (TPR) repeat protein